MRKLLLALLCCAILPAISWSQVKIKYTGDPLPSKAVGKIESMMGHMWDYYSSMGLKEAMEVELKVFKSKKEGYRYMRGLYPDDPNYIEQPHDKTMGGGLAAVYIPKKKLAVLLGIEHGTDEALTIIYHELSHHYTRMLFKGATYPPIWLNEGLAEHFECLKLKRNGVVSEFPHANKGKVKTLIMLGDLNVEKFLNLTQKEFMEMQRNEGQTCYSLAHVTVTVLLENLSVEQRNTLISQLQKRPVNSKVSDIVASIYPGGLPALEKEILEFVSR